MTIEQGRRSGQGGDAVDQEYLTVLDPTEVPARAIYPTPTPLAPASPPPHAASTRRHARTSPTRPAPAISSPPWHPPPVVSRKFVCWQTANREEQPDKKEKVVARFCCQTSGRLLEQMSGMDNRAHPITFPGNSPEGLFYRVGCYLAVAKTTLSQTPVRPGTRFTFRHQDGTVFRFRTLAALK